MGMKIALFTNTYLPHVGGVARSVKTMEDAFWRHGHEVKIVTPDYDHAIPAAHVLRVPAIQNFNGSDFSLSLPLPNVIRESMDRFQPDLVHSHHPFLLGDAALREARKMGVPIVFTHHTLYERYTHYVPLDSPALKRAAVQLATEYGNLCDQVIAPSESIARLLGERGVTSPIQVIPTGIDTQFFGSGDGDRFRRQFHLPPTARVIGHVGRLAREKNLGFLARAVAECLGAMPEAWFLVVGEGDAQSELAAAMPAADGGPSRLVTTGKLSGQPLADAYAAMDCFVFASQSETQGLVLAEAMAAGLPVVALDGSGVRDIVRHESNGLLLPADAPTASFAASLRRLMESPDLRQHCAEGGRATAESYDASHCVARLLDCYHRMIHRTRASSRGDLAPWDRLRATAEVEWNLLVEKVSAAAAAVAEPADSARSAEETPR
jgi:1,2-diacylglycerol 3-alpha-glucosyltransferase